MKIISKIILIDGSEHATKQRAENHLYNLLSKGNDLELFEKLSNKSTLKVKEIFIENHLQIVKTLQIIEELKELGTLTNF